MVYSVNVSFYIANVFLEANGIGFENWKLTCSP
jgi:hypothetical protein